MEETLIYSCSSTCIKKGSEKLAAELNIQEINSEEAAGDLARIGRAASAPFKFKWAYGPGRTIGNELL